MSSENQTRPRRTTLECFNEELAVLDRPLENEVEYYDDPPPPSPWRWAGGIAGAAVLLGVAAGFLLTRQPSVALASAERPLPQLPVVAIQAVAPAAMAETPAPATTAIEPSAPTAVEEPATNERSVRQAPASKAAWAKLARRQGRRR